jgi:type II secretion system protein N
LFPEAKEADRFMRFKPGLILYVVAGVAFFLFWLVVVFPYDALQSRVITEIQNRTKGRYQIEMKDMDLSLFGSVTFDDLKVHEQGGGKKELVLKTPLLKLGFSPFGVLSNKIDYDFFLKGAKTGELEGSYAQNNGSTELTLEFDKFPLADLKFLMQKAKVGLTGSLDGEVDLRISPRDPGDNDGKIDMQLSNLATEPTSIMLDRNDPASAMSLPEIKLSGPKGSHIQATVVKDQLQIQSIKLTGGDLELDLKGSVQLVGESAQDYRINIEGGFKMTDKLAQALPILFLIEKQKNEQGIYPLIFAGRLGRPNVQIGKFRVPL